MAVTRQGSSLAIEIEGADKLIARCQEGGKRIIAKPLRTAFRVAAKAVKANVITTARPISRSLTRKIRVSIDRGIGPVYAPRFGKVVNAAAWVNVAENGRHPGAKMPPIAALKGGFAAAKVVAVRGIPGHGFMSKAEQMSRPAVVAAFAAAAREIEAAWRD